MVQPFQLAPHPGAPHPAATRIDIEIAPKPDGALLLAFRLCAPASSLRIPAPGNSDHTDGLWRHTCFEAFIATPGAQSYAEFNFSPSGQWASYRFSDYRQRDGSDITAGPPKLAWQRSGDQLSLRASLPPAMLPAARVLELGLSAVVEDAAGRLSYWALVHPTTDPDFHHRAGFSARVARH